MAEGYGGSHFYDRGGGGGGGFTGDDDNNWPLREEAPRSPPTSSGDNARQNYNPFRSPPRTPDAAYFGGGPVEVDGGIVLQRYDPRTRDDYPATSTSSQQMPRPLLLASIL